MTTEGKQCVFPFKYKNKTENGDDQELIFNKCSTEDIYRPWCPTSKKYHIPCKMYSYGLYFCYNHKKMKSKTICIFKKYQVTMKF